MQLLVISDVEDVSGGNNFAVVGAIAVGAIAVGANISTIA